MNTKQDLIVLVADGQMEVTLNGILYRGDSLGIRNISAKIFVHPSHDPGCLNKGYEFLRSFSNQFEYALILFDREGCGQEDKSREVLEKKVEDKLANVGWANRSAVIVIDPELETWVWSKSKHVEEVLGWENRNPSLYEWLNQQGYLLENCYKVIHPKEAMENALRTVNKQRSSSYYGQLAKVVSLKNCTDPSFVKLKTKLQSWFPKEN